MTVEMIHPDDLGKAIRKLIYTADIEGNTLAPLYTLAEWFNTPIDQSKVVKSRRRVWAGRIAIRMRRRAAKYGLTEHFTRTQAAKLFDYYDNTCLQCGSTDSLSIDHIRPLSRGGSNTVDNLQPVCCNCNLERIKQKRFDDLRTHYPLWFADAVGRKNNV